MLGSVFQKLALVWLFTGLVIKIVAIYLEIQSMFYFGFACSMVGVGFLIAVLIQLRAKTQSNIIK